MSITQPVCLFVALGIQHAMHMHHIVLIVSPVNNGNHWANPPMIANTAPVDRT